MPRSRTTGKILSLDGGGIRGLFSATILNEFMKEAEIKPKDWPDAFDIYTGTSIGGIQALAYAAGKTPQDMIQFFREKGKIIFPKTWDFTYKMRVIMGLSTADSFYDQEPLKEVLTEVFGDMTLDDLQCFVLIPAWDATEHKPILYSNFKKYQDFAPGLKAKCVDVALATSAAPLYFPAFEFEGKKLIDGGVFHNNPVITGDWIARRLYFEACRFCVLSIGTGKKKSDFVPKMESLLKQDPQLHGFLQELQEKRDELIDKHKIDAVKGWLFPKNVEYLWYLMNDVFIPGMQEYSDKLMALSGNNVFTHAFYLRLQGVFETGENADMDDASDANLDALQEKALKVYKENSNRLKSFIEQFNYYE